MLTQRLGLLQHADIQLGAARFRELRELDRARQPSRSGADNHDVELHAVARAFRTVRQNQPVQR